MPRLLVGQPRLLSPARDLGTVRVRVRVRVGVRVKQLVALEHLAHVLHQRGRLVRARARARVRVRVRARVRATVRARVRVRPCRVTTAFWRPG